MYNNIGKKFSFKIIERKTRILRISEHRNNKVYKGQQKEHYACKILQTFVNNLKKPRHIQEINNRINQYILTGIEKRKLKCFEQ